MDVLKQLLARPLWQVPGMVGEGDSYSLDMVRDYVMRLSGRSRDSVVTATQEHRGYLLLDYHWQTHMGDLAFNTDTLPDIGQLKTIVLAAGLKLALTINPFVSVESKHFKYGVRERLFVMERNSTTDKFIPALTWFKVRRETKEAFILLFFILFVVRMCQWRHCWTSPTPELCHGYSPNCPSSRL